MNNLQADGLVLDDIKYVELTPRELATWQLERGDILFNRTNSKELVGKCEVFNVDGDWVFASYLMRFRVDTSMALPEFVAAFLNTRAGRAQINRESRQIIGMSNINAEELRTLRTPLPDLQVQADLLATLDAARETRRHRLTNANELIRDLDGVVLQALDLRLPPPFESTVYAIRTGDAFRSRLDAGYHSPRFHKAEEELSKNPLPKQSLGMLAELAGGATPRRGDEELYASEGIRFLRIMNVAPFEIVLDDVKYIASEVHTGELGRSQLRADDVLMTITGRVGTAAVVSLEVLPANINQHIVRLRLTTDLVLPEYLTAYLNSSFGLLLTNRGVSGGTRIAVDYETVRRLQIPIPSRDIQQHIVAQVHARRAEAQRLRLEAEAEWEQAKIDFERVLLDGSPMTAAEGTF